MRVMCEVTEPVGREHTMTKSKSKAAQVDVRELLERDEDFLKTAPQALVQAALEAEMTERIGAEKGERTEARLAYRTCGGGRGGGFGLLGVAAFTPPCPAPPALVRGRPRVSPSRGGFTLSRVIGDAAEIPRIP